MKRRTLLTWSTPIVASVVLPAHAQTSICTEAMIAGIPLWNAEVENGYVEEFHLSDDGAGVFVGISSLSWSLNGNIINIMSDSPDSETQTMTGTMNDTCDGFSGLWNGSVPFTARAIHNPL